MEKIIKILLILLLLTPFGVLAEEKCSKENIKIKSIKQIGKTSGVEEISEASIEDNQINVKLKMIDLEDYIEYKLKIENTTNENIIFDENTLISKDEHFLYEIAYEDNSNTIEAHTSKNINLKIIYQKEIENSKYENGIYQLIESNTLKIIDQNLTNPNTGTTLYIWILIAIGIILVVGIIITKNNYVKALCLLILCILPCSVRALCQYEIELKTTIEVKQRPKLELENYFTMIPDSSSYTISTNDTGYNTDQSIIPNELTLWRVIAKNEDGTIDAVSEYTSSNEVCIIGKNGYTHFIKTMQNIAKEYKKEGYTDKTRMMGYDGQTLTIEDTSAFDGTITTAPSQTSTGTPKEGTGEEYNNGILGDTLYLKDYLLVKNIYGNTIAKKIGTTNNTSYWLASRRYVYFGTTSFAFYGRFAYFEGGIGYHTVRYYDSGWRNYTACYSVRPIITLKKEIKVEDGSGTIETPYTITN